ncbi:MAG: hypothetical protein C0605_07240 [Hyphomicrobiales bacterium]|nr:MAG: hypothetical protein C0605_07240 [Hyphomicrobiales bacterium]
MKTTPQQLLDRLVELGIEARTHTHPPLHTVEESQALRGDIPGAHCKNLFLKDKKGAFWLVVTLEDTPVDLKQLKKHIGSAHLSFGRAEYLRDMLGVEPGSVTPFALINDPDGRVNVVLDSEMMAFEWINFHPLVNTATTTIRPGDLLRFVKACGFEPQLLEVAPKDA